MDIRQISKEECERYPRRVRGQVLGRLERLRRRCSRRFKEGREAYWCKLRARMYL